MRLIPSRHVCLPVVAGAVALVLPFAADAARMAPGHPTVARAGARPAGDVVDRAVARWPAKVKRAVMKTHRR